MVSVHLRSTERATETTPILIGDILDLIQAIFPLAWVSYLIQWTLGSVYVPRGSLGKVSGILHTLVNSQSKMSYQYHLEKKKDKYKKKEGLINIKRQGL